MKPTFFLIILCPVFLGSCKTTSSAKTISTFEQTLGMDNSKALSDFVDAFENEILRKKYPSLETDKAYIQMLSEEPYSIAQLKLYDLLSDKSLENFLRSQLWDEIYASVDSVWVENSELNSRRVYRSEDGKIEVGKMGYMLRDPIDQDSLIKREWNICYFNPLGKYFRAIDKIKNGNPFLEEFYDVKNKVGEISTVLFREMISRHHPNMKDYMVKRVVAVELSKFINDARIVK